FVFFFFSSRRRHTRSDRDWSSDVCSSDLHMNLCLLCRACETACPSGVKFGFLMESARGQIERHYQYSAADRRFKHLILRTFTDPRRLRAVTGLLSFYQRSGLQKLVRASGTLRLFGRLGKMEALLPAIPDKRRRTE